jgi:hypothetical protein
MLKSVDAVIDALGGTAAAAALAGRTGPAASNWRATGRIPAEFFLIFAAALARVGKAADPSVYGIKVPNDGLPS